MRINLLALLLVASLGAAACGGADTTATDADQASPAPADATAEAPDETAPAEGADDDAESATVAIASSDLGDILVDGEGNTLYLFLNDEQSESTCYDDCEENWPPLVGPAQASNGADGSLLGTVQRDDGTEQVTYNDWPLYYFTPDTAAGDTNGQGVGDVWFVVDAAGNPVQETADSEGAARDY